MGFPPVNIIFLYIYPTLYLTIGISSKNFEPIPAKIVIFSVVFLCDKNLYLLL